MEIKFRNLAIIAYGYIILPIIIFFLTWLKLYISVPASILLVVAGFWSLKKDYFKRERKIIIRKSNFIIIIIIFMFWVWISGQGGGFYQTFDNHWRNAVFRDLINNEWPVIYPNTGNALIYYIMYWIVPASFGKLFGWGVANFILYIWTLIGILISYFMITCLLKVTTLKKMIAVALVFIFFSGLNVIGILTVSSFKIYDLNQLSGYWEGWLNAIPSEFPYEYQYSSNNILLQWVYNQTIVPWIITALLMENKKIRNFAFWGLLVLPYAPLPFIGFFLYFLGLACIFIVKKIRMKKYSEVIREIFSVQNLIAIVALFPIFFFFFKANSFGAKISRYVPSEAYDLKRIVLLILFYFLEFGIYMLIIYKENKKNSLYWITLFSLIIIPFFKVGNGVDLCMRASIPGLFVLMILLMKYISYVSQSYKKVVQIHIIPEKSF